MVMTLTVKSKKACPACENKTLTTNETPKVNPVMHYCCATCGFSFSENEDQAKAAKKKQNSSSSSGSDQPWTMGTILVVVMTAVILAITVSNNEGNRQTSSDRSSHQPTVAQTYGS